MTTYTVTLTCEKFQPIVKEFATLAEACCFEMEYSAWTFELTVDGKGFDLPESVRRDVRLNGLTASEAVESAISGWEYSDSDAEWMRGIVMKMTAQEFVNSIEFPCFFFAGNGAPAGHTIAILPETELPVDLDGVTGGTTATGVFECDNLTDGSGLNDWKFSDERGNTITKIQIFSSKEIWEREYSEWAGE